MKKNIKYSLIGTIVLVFLILVFGFIYNFFCSGNKIAGYDFNRNFIPDREEGYIDRVYAHETLWVRNLLKKHISNLRSSYFLYLDECVRQNDKFMRSDRFSLENVSECEIVKTDRLQYKIGMGQLGMLPCLYDKAPDNATDMIEDVKSFFLSNDLRVQVNKKVDSYLSGGIYSLPDRDRCPTTENMIYKGHFSIPVFDSLSYMMLSQIKWEDK
jgi:hypothetical protein